MLGVGEMFRNNVLFFECVWPSMKSVYVPGLHLHTRTEITFQISYVGFLCADCIW